MKSILNKTIGAAMLLAFAFTIFHYGYMTAKNAKKQIKPIEYEQQFVGDFDWSKKSD